MSERGPVLLVAGRELHERGWDRGFVVSTVITIVIIAGVIVGNAVLSGPDRFDLGVVGAEAEATGRAVAELARQADEEVRTVRLESLDAAEAAVEDDDVDAALVDGEVVVKSEPDAELMGFIQTASAAERARESLLEAGLDQEQIGEALAPRPIPVRSLDPVDPERRANSVVAFFGVLLLYGQLFGYGYFLAAGVAEEKSSRVVELIVSTIRPWQLLAGKILGIGSLALIQLVVIGAVSIVVARAAGALEFPGSALEIAGTILLWFLIGFALYCTLFAVAGSVVARQEDLQNSLVPLNVVVLGSLFVAFAAFGDPASPLAVFGSLFPGSAPLVMPVRLALGEAPLWQAVVAIALSLLTTAALIPLAGRLYAGSILRTGPRVKLRAAWRGARI